MDYFLTTVTLNLKQDDDRPQVTKKEKKKKKKVKKTGLSFADDDPSEETENFKLKKSSRYSSNPSLGVFTMSRNSARPNSDHFLTL